MRIFSPKLPALLAVLAVPLASPLGACSSNSAGGQDGGGEDGGLDGGGSSDGQSAAETSGSEDAPGESSTATDAPSPTDATHDARDGAAGDAPVDTGSCDPSYQCITTTCCARPNATCGSLMASGDTVVDSSTGLTWKRSFASAPTDYATAVTDCTAWGGRLPTQAEVTAYAAAQVPCDNQVQWAVPYPADCDWTSTPYSGGGAHYCIYHNGVTPPLAASDGDGHWVQCVK
jgi:hypothetical protein